MPRPPLALPLDDRLSRRRIAALIPLRHDAERRAELRDWITWRRAVVWFINHPADARAHGFH